MPKQRYEGRTAAEAAIRACEALGLTRAELRHTVVSDEGELLGRVVVIEVEAPEGGRSAADSAEPGADEPRQAPPRREPRGRSASRGRTARGEDREPARADVTDGPEAAADDAPSPTLDQEAGRAAATGRPPRGGRGPRGEAFERGERDSQASRGTRGRRASTATASQPELDKAPQAPAPVVPSATSAPSNERGDDQTADGGEGGRGRARSRNRSRGGRGRADRSAGLETAGRSGEAIPAPSVVPTDGAPVPPNAAPAAETASAPARAPRRASPRREPSEREPSTRRGTRSGESSRGQATGVDGLLAMQPADNFAHLQVDELPAVDPKSARSKRVLGMVADLVRLMGFELEPRLVRENEVELHVHLHGPSEKEAIGDKGEVLLSLQFAINRMLSRHEDEGEQVLVLDAGGYRQRRQLAIEKLARELAERAVAHNKAVRLSPMSAHDRRIFHLALKDFAGVGTQSEGDGVFRNLLIVPSAFL